MFISIIGFSDNVYAVNNSYVHTKKGVVPWAKQNYGSNLYIIILMEVSKLIVYNGVIVHHQM